MNRVVTSAPKLDEVTTAMLGTLSHYLPPPTGSLPKPSVTVATMTERAVGIGRNRGSDSVGPFPAISRKGIRLDALARFQFWASDPGKADQAIADLNLRLMADRDALRGAGFLRLALETTPPAEVFPTANAWRRYAEYRVLYEFDYEDTDDAQSLIARIPVTIDGEFDERMSITDEMTRWDNLAAPPLVVRGPFGAGGLSLLVFVAGPPPSAGIVLTRTYDGAPGSPASYGTLANFLAAVSGPNPLVRHARITFPSFSQFRAAFHSDGAPLAMGEHSGVPDSYDPLALVIDPAIQLSKSSDRLELVYKASKFDKIAVAYLRATQF